jgi:YidC/Oxa1 family membrane protein insertase
MEKRVVVFIVLSMLTLFVFSWLQPTPDPAPESAADLNSPAATLNAPAPAAATSPESALAAHAEPTVVGPSAKSVTVETPLYTARFSSRGGTVEAWALKHYADKLGQPVNLLTDAAPRRPLSVGNGADFSYSDRNFEVTGGDMSLGAGQSGTLLFRYVAGTYSIERTYTFSGDTYGFTVSDRVMGLPGYQITLGSDFGLFNREAEYIHVGPVVLVDTDRDELDMDDTETYTEGKLRWVALEDKYFCAAMAAKSEVSGMYVASIAGGTEAAVGYTATGSGTHEFVVYAGPKRVEDLNPLGQSLRDIVDYGFFNIIARPIFWLMKEIHVIVGNYGWSIVLLTIIIRVPFLPLVHKSQQSMKKLQELQPKIKELNEQFKNDAEKKGQATMELYRKHKVNPLGGCLPLLAQIPVFFALYKVLLVSIELRGAPFMLWITDLAQKDPYYVLPLVMGATMFIQQKMTPSGADPKQQKIMLFMPVIFTFMFLGFPSGLVLYWLVNNLLSIAQQLYVNRSRAKAA